MLSLSKHAKEFFRSLLMDLKTLEDIPPWDWPQDAGEMFLPKHVRRRILEAPVRRRTMTRMPARLGKKLLEGIVY